MRRASRGEDGNPFISRTRYVMEENVTSLGPLYLNFEVDLSVNLSRSDNPSSYIYLSNVCMYVCVCVYVIDARPHRWSHRPQTWHGGPSLSWEGLRGWRLVSEAASAFGQAQSATTGIWPLEYMHELCSGDN